MTSLRSLRSITKFFDTTSVDLGNRLFLRGNPILMLLIYEP